MTRAAIQYAGISDVGRVREHNEDRIAWRPDLGVAVLADGMGGHNAGEVASALAVQTIVDELERALRETPLELRAGDDDTEALYLCMNAVAQANAVIHHAAQQQPQCKGMGTTVVLGMFSGERAIIAHAGDSRAYLWHDGALQQLTRDHSVVQDVVRQGLYTEEQARRTFSKNIITRALGVAPDIDVEAHAFELSPGDIILLCSDGLTDRIDDATLALCIRKFGASLEETARELVALANQRGGADNVSVVLAKLPPKAE